MFKRGGHVPTLASTYQAIREHGLADSGYEDPDGPTFERYGGQFDGRGGLGAFGFH